MYQLSIAGFNVEFGVPESFSDTVIINTCGFIGESEKSSLAEIEKYVKLKRQNLIGRLWVMGCYSQKRGESLKEEIPEIDNLYGNFDWQNILRDLGATYICGDNRILVTPPHYAYLKISDGCNQQCSYCAKPQINGPLRSIAMEDIVNECRILAKQGVKEFQIVAQNTTSYGVDLYKKKRIAELVERIADISQIEWIRLHYAYPSGFPIDLLRVIRERNNVCNYLDMAIQHCNSKMLKLMRRGMTKESLIDLIQQIRQEVPNIYLRTTVMTGHPGETETDFEELFEFVKEQKFERLGVFPYSHEKGTYCYRHYADEIPLTVKHERATKIVNLQNQIYYNLNASLLGDKQRIIIDRKEDDYYIGRSEYSTPMADPVVYITSDAELQTGNFYEVTLTNVRGKDIDSKIVINKKQ
jgi:ribosomal protein S12 methylthiotransferase